MSTRGGTRSAKAILCLGLLLSQGAAVVAQECCDPEGPDVLGEGFPETPATCDTVGAWIDRAPDHDGRISFAITGALTAVQGDDALADLLMCEPEGVQVPCVSYHTNYRIPGDVVQMAGGHNRVGERQVMLDPCLTWEAE